MGKNQKSRPEKVATAVKLLYITLGMGVLGFIIFAFTYEKWSPQTIIFGIFIFFLFFIGPMWLFIYKIDKGYNWARITLLVYFIISLIFYIPSIPQSLRTNPINTILGILLMTIQAVALVFLFQKPSSAWFKAVNRDKYSVPTNYQRVSQGNIKMSNWKIAGYFFLVFIITVILISILDVMFRSFGFEISYHFQFIAHVLLPLIVAIWYVKKMIKSGKFDY
jgi:hypothetical protein